MGIRLRPLPKFQFLADAGAPGNGYKVYCYQPGTVTLKDTYTTYTGSVANTNPVILDARGEADIWFNGLYKIKITDASGVEVYTVDNFGEGEDSILTGNYNKVKNGGFETDTAGDGVPDDWTVTDYDATSTSALDATDQIEGLNSLKFTSTGLGGGYGDSDYFEVQASKSISVFFGIKSSVVDVRNVVDILWYTAAKTLISTSNVYNDSATNPTSWAEKTGEVTAPATAKFAKIRVIGCHSSDTTAGSTWFDNVLVTDNMAFKDRVQAFTKTQTWAKGADVASVAALTLGADGNYFDITGTTAITSIVTKGIGTVIKLHFDGILTLTHHATDLILPGGANITTAAGDEAEFVEYATGDWRCTNYFDDKIVAYAGALRKQTLDDALDVSSSSMAATNGSSVMTLRVKLDSEGAGATTRSLAAGATTDFLNSGVFVLYAPIGIKVEYYLNGAWRTDAIFDGTATTAGTVLQAEAVATSSMRLNNTTAGALSFYYHRMTLPTT